MRFYKKIRDLFYGEYVVESGKPNSGISMMAYRKPGVLDKLKKIDCVISKSGIVRFVILPLIIGVALLLVKGLFL
jgi:hypothetical protein